jgi:hypothetical protein
MPVKEALPAFSIRGTKSVHISLPLPHILTCISKGKGGLMSMATELDPTYFFPTDRVPEDVDDLVFLWENDSPVSSDR